MEFVKIYEELSSSAVKCVKIDEKLVKITYNSNIDKEYEFNCDKTCLLYTSPSPRDYAASRMPSSA